MNSKIKTCLSLSQFLEYFPQVNPYRVHQIGYFAPPDETPFPTSHEQSEEARCEDCLFQSGWRGGKLSRDTILNAIQRAEELFADKLGFWPCPRFIANEEAVYNGDCGPSSRASCCIGASITDLLSGEGNFQQTNAIKLKWGYFESAGTMTLTPLGDFAVTRTNTDGDSVFESFTIGPVPVPDCTEPCSIQIFNTLSDRMNRTLLDWQIRPIDVTIDETGGTGNWTATITGHAWTLIQPRHIVRTNPVCQASQDAAAYVDEVSVYIVGVNVNEQGYLRWQNGCSNPLATSCASSIWNKQSLVSVFPISNCGGTQTETNPCQPQVIDISSCCQSSRKNRCPDAAMLNYKAGYPLFNCKLDETIARAIAYLAASFIDCTMCGCSCGGGADDLFDKYKQVESFNLNTGSGGRKTFIRTNIIENPFGVTYGAVEAWRLVGNLRQTTYTFVR